MQMNFMARWEYREDRFELRRWLDAPRAGYRVWPPESLDRPGVIRLEVRRRVQRRYRGLPGAPVAFQRDYPALYEMVLADLVMDSRGWRKAVADALRESRAHLRSLSLSSLGLY